MGLHKISKILAWLIGVAGVVSLVMIISKGDQAIEDALITSGDTSAVDPIYAIGLIIFLLVLAVVLVFVVKEVFAGNIKKTLLSVGTFLVVVVIGYAMASSSIEGLPLVDNAPVTESTSKWVGTGLNTFYILAVLAIVSMIYSGFTKVKNR